VVFGGGWPLFVGGMDGGGTRSVGVLTAGGLVFDRLAERPRRVGRKQIPQFLLHEGRAPVFMFMAGDDEPEDGQAFRGEPAIADAAHAVPSLHRGVSRARRRSGWLDDQELMSLCQSSRRMMGPRPRHATPSTRPRRSSASRETPGRYRVLSAKQPCSSPWISASAKRESWDIGRSHLGLPGQGPLPSSTARCALVAEMDCLALDRDARRSGGSRGFRPLSP